MIEGTRVAVGPTELELSRVEEISVLVSEARADDESIVEAPWSDDVCTVDDDSIAELLSTEDDV